MNFFSDIEMSLTYNPEGSFDVMIGESSHCMRGQLEQVDGKNQLTCNIDGVNSSANVVLNKNTLHIFTAVSKCYKIPCLSCGKISVTVVPIQAK